MAQCRDLRVRRVIATRTRHVFFPADLRTRSFLCLVSFFVMAQRLNRLCLAAQLFPAPTATDNLFVRACLRACRRLFVLPYRFARFVAQRRQNNFKEVITNRAGIDDLDGLAGRLNIFRFGILMPDDPIQIRLDIAYAALRTSISDAETLARRAFACGHRVPMAVYRTIPCVARLIIRRDRSCLGVGKRVGQNQIRGRDAPGKRESVGLYRFENRRAEIRHRLASRAAVVIVERIPRHIVDQQRSVFIIFDILCIDRDRDKTGRIQKTVPFSAVHFVARFGILVVKSQQARIPCV